MKLTKAQGRVFNFMHDFNDITTLQAFCELGETRLSARIFELKRKGFAIRSENIQVCNRYGEKRNVCKYILEGGKDEAK